MFCASFCTYISSASSANASYPATNITNHFLNRQYRNNSTVNTTVMLDLGSVKSISGVFIDNVNFTNMTLIHSTTTAFTASTSATYTITQDERVRRYKIFCPLTTAVMALKIVIPTQSPVDGSTAFKIGRVNVLTSSTVTLSADPQFYEPAPKDFIETNDFLSGGYEDISLGTNLVWNGSFGWSARNKSYESELWSINAIGRTNDVFFYENRDNYANAYLCRLRSNISVEWDEGDIEKINVINLREFI